MFTAEINGKTITGKTITEIKRKASMIANNRFSTVDILEVRTETATTLYYRRNKKCPNNTIERGKWR